MRNFVMAYYADLPTRPYDAWAKVAPNGQKETGQQSFLDFWAKIQSVTLISVTPRDDTSVVARLKYVRNDGGAPMEDRWLRMVLVNGVVLLDASGRIGPVAEATTPGPVFPASSIDSLLLTPEVIRRVTGSGPWQVADSASTPTNHSGLVTPFSCVGVIFTSEQSVYENSGFAAMRNETLKAAPPNIYPGMPLPPDKPEQVEQTIVDFPTPAEAQAVLGNSEKQWRSCAAAEVEQRAVGDNGEDGHTFNFGDVVLHDDVLTVSMTGINRESGSLSCQQVLGARVNVVVSVRSCLSPDQEIPITATVGDPNLAGTYAEQLAADILVEVKV